MEISTVSIVTDKNTLSSRSGDNCFQIVNDITIVENIVRVVRILTSFFESLPRKSPMASIPYHLQTLGCIQFGGCHSHHLYRLKCPHQFI